MKSCRTRAAGRAALLLPISFALALVLVLPAPSARADGDLVVYNKGQPLRYDPDVGAELKEVILETWSCTTGKLVKKETIEAYFHLSDDREIITPDALCAQCQRVFEIEKKGEKYYFRGMKEAAAAAAPAPAPAPTPAPAPPEPAPAVAAASTEPAAPPTPPPPPPPEPAAAPPAPAPTEPAAPPTPPAAGPGKPGTSRPPPGKPGKPGPGKPGPARPAAPDPAPAPPEPAPAPAPAVVTPEPAPTPAPAPVEPAPADPATLLARDGPDTSPAPAPTPEPAVTPLPRDGPDTPPTPAPGPAPAPAPSGGGDFQPSFDPPSRSRPAPEVTRPAPAPAPAPPDPFTEKARRLARAIVAVDERKQGSSDERSAIIAREIDAKSVTEADLARLADAIADDPEIAEPQRRYYVFRSFGWYFFLEKEGKKAVYFYDRCIAILPDNRGAHFQKALAHELLGENDAALRAYAASLAARPHLPTIEYMQKLLDQIASTERLTEADLTQVKSTVASLRTALEGGDEAGARAKAKDLVARLGR